MCVCDDESREIQNPRVDVDLVRQTFQAISGALDLETSERAVHYGDIYSGEIAEVELVDDSSTGCVVSMEVVELQPKGMSYVYIAHEWSVRRSA